MSRFWKRKRTLVGVGMIVFHVSFLGVLGGVATGGFLGLFVGSTVLAVFYTILMEWSAPLATAEAESNSEV